MNPDLEDGECFVRGFKPLPKKERELPGPEGPGF